MSEAFCIKEVQPLEMYESIKEWKNTNISAFLTNNVSLNTFHDQVMLKVLEVAIGNMKQTEVPCKFTWFITGSGGRFEQGLISDQDHGIIYEKSTAENDLYFKKLGEEISLGLEIVGYPLCNGNIMSSNPVWCKSISDWENQLTKWMGEESWESIRYLQIFYDARSLYGESDYVQKLKTIIHQYQNNHPTLLKRFVSNVKHVKNAIGPMGQIIVEQHGIYQGCLDLKYSAFLPYVNSIRLLAIKEGISETSTIARINRLQENVQHKDLLKYCYENFTSLLNYRLSLFDVKAYDDTHYLNLKNLSREQRKEIKQILKYGKKLHDAVIELISTKSA